LKLEIGRINIKDVQFGDQTFVKDGILTIDKAGLVATLKEDERIKDVEIDLAKPGEKVRLIPVKDVIEPRVKVEGTGAGFPLLIQRYDTP
jgi:sarcosine reductase